MTVFTAQELKQFLPHRYPFLFVDAIDEVVPGESAKARKNVTINEPFFQGHFPQEPVMPGVLIVETMAQVAVAPLIVQAKENNQDTSNLIGYLGALNKVKFRRKVIPGDVLHIEIEFLKQKRNIAVIKGVARVEDKVACEAEMTVIIGDSEANV